MVKYQIRYEILSGLLLIIISFYLLFGQIRWDIFILHGVPEERIVETIQKQSIYLIPSLIGAFLLSLKKKGG